MTEDRIRELLREMRDEPVPADSTARVRLAIEARSRSRIAGFRRHWKLWAGILALACAALIAITMREPVGIAPPAVEATQTQIPAEVSAAVSPPPAARRVVHRAPRAVPPRSAAEVIRIETDDPDIVIVLVGG